MGERVYIVIAAYNEGKAIRKVINSLHKEGYKNIVVVDDGSSDKTGQIAVKAGAEVLTHVINCGQGAGLKTGIDYALKKGADIVVTYDADGQFLPTEIDSIIKPIREKKCDVTLGSRFMGQTENMPFTKKVVLKLGILVVKILYKINVTDSQNGFRGLSNTACKKISITANRMEHAGEIFGEIVKKGLSYKEVPVTVIYSDYSLTKGQSWKKSIKLGIKMLIRRLM